MFDARTQHKEKTAIGISKLADVVAEKLSNEDDTSLESVREQCDHDVVFGGMRRFSKAKTALITEVIPDAPSEWPTFGFTDPM